MENVFGRAYKEEMKAIVKEAMRELILEGVFSTSISTGEDDRATIQEVEKHAEETSKHIANHIDIKKEAEAKVEAQEASTNIEDLKLELDSLTYNQLKAKAKELGLETTGKKPEIYERLITALTAVAPKEVAEEEITPKEKVATTAKVTSTNETVPDEEDDVAEDLKEMQAFLKELTEEELLAIFAQMGFPKPKNVIKSDLITYMNTKNNTEKLVTALEALGYYDEEEEEEEVIDEGSALTPEDEKIVALKDSLNELSLEVLADLNVSFELSPKGKKEALVDRVIALVVAEALTVEEVEEAVQKLSEVEVVEDDSTEEDDEAWYTEAELSEMKDMDLINIAREYELEVPYKGKGALRKINRVALIDLILDLPNQVDEAEEVEEVEDTKMTEERKAKEASVEESIRAQYPKKLKDASIAKYLKKYYDGDPAKAKLEKAEALEEYIKIQKSLVDDDGDQLELSECYLRGEKYFCCGKELKNIDGNYTCEVCGEQYQA